MLGQMQLAQANPFLAVLLFIGGIIGYIIFLVAVWRAMIAHESIADTLSYIARKQAGQSPTTQPYTEQQRPPLA